MQGGSASCLVATLASAGCGGAGDTTTAAAALALLACLGVPGHISHLNEIAHTTGRPSGSANSDGFQFGECWETSLSGLTVPHVDDGGRSTTFSGDWVGGRFDLFGRGSSDRWRVDFKLLRRRPLVTCMLIK
uniref:Secreted protein n=1 Tax=Oryza punctata TaxID=4537 RepID=A0A0E0MD63_ORYPU